MRKYYNVELNKENASRFREYCRDMHHTFETSECGNMIHFEVKLDVFELANADKFLETL